MPAKNHLSQNQKQRLIKLLKESDDIAFLRKMRYDVTDTHS